VRPLGLAGSACLLLTGSGMAFPWQVIRTAPWPAAISWRTWPSVSIWRGGHPPRLCPQAEVTSELPSGKEQPPSSDAAGSTATCERYATPGPALFAVGVVGVGLACWGGRELSVPPLSLLFLVWAMTLAAAGRRLARARHPRCRSSCWRAQARRSCWPIFAAWPNVGRERLPLTSLLAAPVLRPVEDPDLT